MTYFTGRYDASRIRRENQPSSNVVPIRPPSAAQVNVDTATQILRDLSDVDLEQHITALQDDHAIKRAALHMAADAFARALNEKVRRTERG